MHLQLYSPRCYSNYSAAVSKVCCCRALHWHRDASLSTMFCVVTVFQLFAVSVPTTGLRLPPPPPPPARLKCGWGTTYNYVSGFNSEFGVIQVHANGETLITNYTTRPSGITSIDNSSVDVTYRNDCKLSFYVHLLGIHFSQLVYLRPLVHPQSLQPGQQTL